MSSILTVDSILKESYSKQSYDYFGSNPNIPTNFKNFIGDIAEWYRHKQLIPDFLKEIVMETIIIICLTLLINTLILCGTLVYITHKVKVNVDIDKKIIIDVDTNSE